MKRYYIKDTQGGYYIVEAETCSILNDNIQLVDADGSIICTVKGWVYLWNSRPPKEHRRPL